MKKKHFKVHFLNKNIDKGFFEEGLHNNFSEKDLVDWFLERREKMGWEKIPDIKIDDITDPKQPIDRTDLVMKIIKPHIFTEEDIIRAVFVDPLPLNNVAPALVKNETYIVRGTTFDKEGNQHLNVGLQSTLQFIHSYETLEELPDGDKIHWCHPGRFELVA